MRYTIHGIGDLHQPLHAVSMYNSTFLTGDAGGNLEKMITIN